MHLNTITVILFLLLITSHYLKGEKLIVTNRTDPWGRSQKRIYFRYKRNGIAE